MKRTIDAVDSVHEKKTRKGIKYHKILKEIM